MVLARYSAVSSGQVIPAKRPNDQQSELIGIKYLKQLSVCAGAYQIVTAPIIHGFIHQFSMILRNVRFLLLFRKYGAKGKEGMGNEWLRDGMKWPAGKKE